MEQKEAAERRKTERAKVYIPPEEDKPVKKGPVEDIQEEDKVDLQKFKKKIEKAQSEKRKKKANNTT